MRPKRKKERKISRDSGIITFIVVVLSEGCNRGEEEIRPEHRDKNINPDKPVHQTTEMFTKHPYIFSSCTRAPGLHPWPDCLQDAPSEQSGGFCGLKVFHRCWRKMTNTFFGII